MAMNLSAFMPVGTPQSKSIGGAAGANTLTFSIGQTGLPITACRVTNLGTATLFVQFISSNNTVTVGVTNAQPVLSNQTQYFGTAGQPCVALNVASTFTVTAYITGGIGHP